MFTKPWLEWVLTGQGRRVRGNGEGDEVEKKNKIEQEKGLVWTVGELRMIDASLHSMPKERGGLCSVTWIDLLKMSQIVVPISPMARTNWSFLRVMLMF